MLEVPSRAVSLLKHLRGCHMSFLSPLTRVSARALVISPLPQQLVSVCWCLWCVLVGQRGIGEGSCTLCRLLVHGLTAIPRALGAALRVESP